VEKLRLPDRQRRQAGGFAAGAGGDRVGKDALGAVAVAGDLIHPNHHRNPNLNLSMFDHEKLRVYQEALAFASWTETVLARAKKSSPLHDQLDRARTSILLNIAEGNGRFTAADRCRFFDMARGSTLECAACLDLLAVKNVLAPKDQTHGKMILEKIVSMLVGLIRSNSADRLHEAPVAYQVGRKKDQDYD
jgi:four helix bundle protein